MTNKQQKKKKEISYTENRERYIRYKAYQRAENINRHIQKT